MTAMANETFLAYGWEGIYEPAEAARYIKAAGFYPRTPRTIAGWFRRWTADSELSESAGGEVPVIFSDLISMRLVAAFMVAGVKWHEVITVVEWLRQYSETAYPLVSRDIWSSVDWVNDVCGLLYPARGAPNATKPDLDEFLMEYILPGHGLTFDEKSGRATSWEPRPEIALNPLIQFGAPCVKGTRIPTAALAGMVLAGDSVESTARDYRISTDEVEAACDWERRVHSR